MLSSATLCFFFKEAEKLQEANVPKDIPVGIPKSLLKKDPPKRVALEGEKKLERIAEKEKIEKNKDLLKPIDKARPYLHRALVGAVPGGFIGGWTSTKSVPRAARGVGAVLGATVSMADKRLEDLSKRREYKSVLKSYQEPLSKTSGMGGLDLRGMKSTPFATKGSKSLAQKGLDAGNRSFTGPSMTAPISQQAVRV